MEERYHYRLSKVQKREIAQNLVGVLEKNENITGQTRRFTGDWILTGPEEKRKAFFDVWEIVFKELCTNNQTSFISGMQ